MEWSLDLRFEQGVKFLIEGLEMGEIVIEEVAVLESVSLSEELVHLEGADGSKACITRQVPR